MKRRLRSRAFAASTALVTGIMMLGAANANAATNPAPSSTNVTLTSGGAGVQSEFYLYSHLGTSNGLPTGGTCSNTPGIGIDDATYDVHGVDRGDAYDDGLLFWVGNTQVTAPTNWNVETDTGGLNRAVTSGPVTASGLQATVEYRTMTTQQVLRSTLWLTNPGTTSSTVTVTMATNNGSDSSTGIRGTSSGDTQFTDADRWVVSSDSATTPSDPVNTHVLAGPGNVASPPTGTSTTVFDCATTDGILANYQVTVPAGETRGLLFYNELSDTNANALASAARFNTNPTGNDELIAGLSPSDLASVVNWNFPPPPPVWPEGYRFVASDGGVFSFNAPFHGSLGNVHLNKPIVGMATDPATGGYWLVASDGGVFAFNAPFYGSLGSVHLTQPIVGMAAAPDGSGYWLVASDGGVFAFNAPFSGSLGNVHLNKPIIGMATTPDGSGYWLVASDGGVFAFNAPFLGSTGGVTLNKPVVGMASNVDGSGYWLVASDGGVFAFNAPFYGSTGGVTLNKPVVGMVPDFATGGYRTVASDGGVFAFHAPFLGSTGGIKLAQPVVGMANSSY